MERNMQMEHVVGAEYTPLTQEELTDISGESYPRFSRYSMKVSVDGEIAGYICIEDIPLELSVNEDDDDAIKTYKGMINDISSFYLRKMEINGEHLDKLKILFEKTVCRLPYFSLLWCKPSVDNGGLIEKLDEFQPLAYNIDNSIHIFSLHC